MIYATNRKASHDYTIKSTIMAGLALTGHQTKIIRSKHAQLQGAYLVFAKTSPTLINVSLGADTVTLPVLIAEKEIIDLKKHLQIAGNTVIVLELVAVRRWIKANLGLVVGKKQYEKRATIKKRDLDRLERKNQL